MVKNSQYPAKLYCIPSRLPQPRFVAIGTFACWADVVTTSRAT
jgi:hypothetical protein